MGNQILEIIKKRRSTRLFSDEPIDNESLNIILEAGCYSPSAYDRQSWYFVAIQNKEILDDLNRETKRSLKQSDNEQLQKIANNEEFNIFYDALTVILVCGDESDHLHEIDCAVATQNMLLTAESLLIGSCWIGLVNFLSRDKDNTKLIEHKKKLRIPDGYKIIHAVALGYRKSPIHKASQRKENAYIIIDREVLV